ncbi:MAG: disulfide oxidoreductase [Candidatus Paceibacterota bacterium]|jgi:disulfide bond formation protein DsbB
MHTVIQNLILVLVVIAQILIVLYAIGLIIRKKNPNSPLVKALSENGFLLAFLVALAATVGSLYYSDIRGYNPCKFCWFQRIFMYPQVILLGIALWKKDYWMKTYGVILSVIGGIIALNHYILQITGTSILPCSAVGQSVSCNKVFVMHLGYITIPMMALTAFILMTLALLMWKKPAEVN